MYYKSPLTLGLVVVILVLLGVGLAAWQFVSIQSTGTPLGPALRSERHLFQLISTQERYLPSLHRNPSKNRYRIDLLVIPIADPTKQETFTLLRQQQANALTPVTKILGADGDVVWINALDVFAVNLKTGRIVRSEDLRKMNPELELFLPSARAEFTDRFIAISPDWNRAYSFSAETFKATACEPPPRGSWMDERFKDRIEGSLCSGGLISSNEWIAVATPEDAKSDLKPGFSLPRDFTAGEKDHVRQLFRGMVDSSGARPRIVTSERLASAEYRAATFLRSKPGGTVFQAGNPISFFLLHRVGKELFAPFTLARITPDGKEISSTATDIGRLNQVLPGNDTIALIGERPPAPNKVPEPILVLIDTSSGTVCTVSLWRK